MVDRGPQQRMAEVECCTDGSQHACGLGLSERRSADAQRGGGCQHDAGIASALGGGDQQQGLRLRRELPDAGEEELVNGGAEWHRVGQRITAGELLRRQRGRDLDQCQRIARRDLDDDTAHVRHQSGAGVDQHAGRDRVERPEPIDREAIGAKPGRHAGTGGEEHRDPLRLNAPGHEREGIGGRCVEPLSVVDEAQHRLVGGHLGEQVEDAEGDDEAVLGVPGREAERAAMAAAWTGGMRSMLVSTGPSSWCSPANGSSASASRPTARSTHRSSAFAPAWSSSAVLP